ncbi:MAG TPA: matrixin family metalloprotease [Vicinamibacterales bacterium]|nr:matrixin family metalloprotease [Vicinamibacterales bacterium]
MHPRTRIAGIAALMAAALLLQDRPSAYSTSGSKWATSPVPYRVNAANMDLPAAQADAAMRIGADSWALQSGASIAFQHAGASTQTTTGFDNLNLVVFRDASSGSAIATTYWWSSGGRILDADIVFWDGEFKFFAGTTGCSGGFYIEDIAAHEFGHALGLGHSTVVGTTMYPSTSSCNTANRTLHDDDIAGVRSLYPPATLPLAPTGLRFVGQ